MWLLFVLMFGPWVEREERATLMPGVGLREETDRSPALRGGDRPRGVPDDRRLARNLVDLVILLQDPGVRKSTDHAPERAPAPGTRAPDDSPGVRKDRTEYRPPRDIASDRINETSRTRPIFVTKNQELVAKQAAELGKPVLWWSFWPDTYDTTAAYFNELTEAQHILMTGDQIARHKVDGQEWIVYQHRDGSPRWIKASEIFGAGCAEKLRRAWLEPKVQPGLTPTDKQAVLDATVRIVLQDGGPLEVLSIRDILNSGYRFTYSDYKALERKGLSELELAYVSSLSGRVAGGSTAPSIGTSYTPRSSAANYTGYPAGYGARAIAPTNFASPASYSAPSSAPPAFRGGGGGAVARAPLRGG